MMKGWAINLYDIQSIIYFESGRVNTGFSNANLRVFTLNAQQYAKAIKFIE